MDTPKLQLFNPQKNPQNKNKKSQITATYRATSYESNLRLEEKIFYN